MWVSHLKPWQVLSAHTQVPPYLWAREIPASLSKRPSASVKLAPSLISPAHSHLLYLPQTLTSALRPNSCFSLLIEESSFLVTPSELLPGWLIGAWTHAPSSPWRVKRFHLPRHLPGWGLQGLGSGLLLPHYGQCGASRQRGWVGGCFTRRGLLKVCEALSLKLNLLVSFRSLGCLGVISSSSATLSDAWEEKNRPTGPGLSCEKKVVWGGEWGEVVSWGRMGMWGKDDARGLGNVASSLLTFSPHPPSVLKASSQSWSHKGWANACSVVSDSLWPHGLKPARLLCPWDFPGKNTGVGCHFLLQGRGGMDSNIILHLNYRHICLTPSFNFLGLFFFFQDFCFWNHHLGGLLRTLVGYCRWAQSPTHSPIPWQGKAFLVSVFQTSPAPGFSQTSPGEPAVRLYERRGSAVFWLSHLLPTVTRERGPGSGLQPQADPGAYWLLTHHGGAAAALHPSLWGSGSRPGWSELPAGPQSQWACMCLPGKKGAASDQGSPKGWHQKLACLHSKGLRRSIC